MVKRKMAKPQDKISRGYKAKTEAVMEDEDTDLDIYGGSTLDDEEEGDHDEVDLGGDDEALDLDDLDTDPISDDEDAIDGMSLSDDEEDDLGGDPVADLAIKLKDIADELVAVSGADEGDEEDDFGSDPADLEFDDEPADEIDADEGEFEDEGDFGDGDDFEDEDEGPKLREDSSTDTSKKPKKLPGKPVPGNAPREDQLHKSGKEVKGQATLPPGKGATGNENRPDNDKAMDTTFKASKGKGKAKVPKAQGAAKVGNNGGGPEKTVPIDKVMTKALESLHIDIAAEAEAFVNLGGFLSEDAKARGRQLFVNAVKKKIGNLSEAIDRHYRSVFREEVQAMQDSVVEKLDEYLDFVVAEYLEENALVVDQGLSLDISESFLKGMRQLFEEHHVVVPKAKVDLVEKLQRQLAEQEEQKKELYERSVKLRRENIRFHRQESIRTVAEDLSALEAEKFERLAEGLDYRSRKQFEADLGILKQTHFGSGRRRVRTPEAVEFETLNETVTPSQSTGDDIAQYAQAVARHARKR